MDFLYKTYEYMLTLLETKGYTFCDYTDYSDNKKCVILRHDVDFSLEKALKLAKIESSRKIKSTYFILLSTNFYNVFSTSSSEIIKELGFLGHNIGLHFDEKRYEITDNKSLEYHICREQKILEGVLEKNIETVSMHRPSKWILEGKIEFKNIINTYSQRFFKDFKYLSDSRMHWREDVLEVIEGCKYDKLHILTHPFWYSFNNETIKQKLMSFISTSRIEKYTNIKENFRDLESVLMMEEVL